MVISGFQKLNKCNIIAKNVCGVLSQIKWVWQSYSVDSPHHRLNVLAQMIWGTIAKGECIPPFGFSEHACDIIATIRALLITNKINCNSYYLSYNTLFQNKWMYWQIFL